jgi:ornithine carbamoyltransferase
MKTNTFRGRDYITLLTYSREEIETLLDVALDLKRKFATGQPHHLLSDKSLFMIFYNQSLRTRNSFEAGMTQLGGHAHFLDPGKIYAPALEGDEQAYSTERVADVARTLSRMGHGISIRMYGEPVDWIYGKANQIVNEFARWSDIPVINMECDKYHPCQALADLLTIKEKLGGFRGRRLVMSWAYSPSAEKPLSVPQSVVIAASKMGMEVVLAHPKGLELDPEVIKACQVNVENSGGSFQISHDMQEAFQGAHVVYPKSWTSMENIPPHSAKPEMEKTEKLFNQHKDWICDKSKMELCDRGAVYMHCLPCDRGFEVTNEVIDGPRSVVFDEAENRLHVQKAVMAMAMR